MNFIKQYVFIIGFAWTIICLAALYSHMKEDSRQSVAQTLIRAETMLARDILYRDWVASHGGVYVPITDDSPPNPHLEFLPERDLETKDGRQLTLVNPSYMTTQAFEMDNRLGGSISKLTSLKYLNPENAPDDWEQQALLKLSDGVPHVSELVDVNGKAYVRSLRPFYVEATCLKCHAEQGCRLGDVRGGLSISIPFRSDLLGNLQHKLLSMALFAALWLAGIAGVALLGRKLYAQTCSAIESDRQRDHAEMSLNYVSNYDRRTNLPNRFKFEEDLFALFNDAEIRGDTVAVTTIEVRNYKQILDNFDHPVGDSLFKLLAERIATIISPADSVARFGEIACYFHIRLLTALKSQRIYYRIFIRTFPSPSFWKDMNFSRFSAWAQRLIRRMRVMPKDWCKGLSRP